MRFNRGFTLIELLVVIAIIGLLASVVLASLGTARSKAADAAIKSNLESAQAQAAIYFGNNNSYGLDSVAPHDCTTITSPSYVFGDPSGGVSPQLNAAIQNSGLTETDAVCYSSTGGAEPSYVIAVPLRTNPEVWWCIDSIGNSKCVSGNGCQGGDINWNFPDGDPGTCDDITNPS